MGLYIASTRPYLPLGDDQEAWLARRFGDIYRQRQSWLLVLHKSEVGWIQLQEAPRSLILRQLHLVAQWRCQGIGTILLRDLLGRAAIERKDVALRVMKGNPAQALYARLGFQIVRADDLRVHMRWRVDRAAISR